MNKKHLEETGVYVRNLDHVVDVVADASSEAHGNAQNAPGSADNIAPPEDAADRSASTNQHSEAAGEGAEVSVSCSVLDSNSSNLDPESETLVSWSVPDLSGFGNFLPPVRELLAPITYDRIRVPIK